MENKSSCRIMQSPWEFITLYFNSISVKSRGSIDVNEKEDRENQGALWDTRCNWFPTRRRAMYDYTVASVGWIKIIIIKKTYFIKLFSN